MQAGTSERVSVQRDKNGNVSLASVSFLLVFSSLAKRYSYSGYIHLFGGSGLILQLFSRNEQSRCILNLYIGAVNKAAGAVSGG